MDTIKTYDYGCKTYCLLEDIKKKKLNEGYFVGCKSMRKCVERRKIPTNKVMYMRNGKTYDSMYKLADVYVEKEYIMKNIVKINLKESISSSVDGYAGKVKAMVQENVKEEYLEEYIPLTYTFDYEKIDEKEEKKEVKKEEKKEVKEEEKKEVNKEDGLNARKKLEKFSYLLRAKDIDLKMKEIELKAKEIELRDKHIYYLKKMRELYEKQNFL